MEVDRDFSMHNGKMLFPATRIPDPPEKNQPDHRLEVVVIFTSAQATIAAMNKAGALLSGLNGRISLLVPQPVPYPLLLENPPVQRDFSERRLVEIANASSIETRVCVYLCRDRSEMLGAVLKPHSFAVVGGRKRWWPTWEKSLAQKLRRAGHEVIFIEAPDRKCVVRSPTMQRSRIERNGT